MLGDEHYLIMRVQCPHCKTRQKIHVEAYPKPTVVTEETIRCLNCNDYFMPNVPNKIIRGPFPA